MSRRKKDQHLYGQLTLECAVGHPLGYIVRTMMGSVYRTDLPVSDNRPAPAHQLTPGEDLTFECLSRRNGGNPRTVYEASWDEIAEQLKTLGDKVHTLR
jgi:hypothetical protein